MDRGQTDKQTKRQTDRLDVYKNASLPWFISYWEFALLRKVWTVFHKVAIGKNELQQQTNFLQPDIDTSTF